jgi:Family of unknown function (DUF6328)
MTLLAPDLSARNETELERSDRHLAELLQEVRVAQTGVQVLFGFLLAVPLAARFATLSSSERMLYFATLTLAGAAAILLIAPSAQHRVLFRCGDKAYIVQMANCYAIAGLTCVAGAVVGALVFVTQVMFGGVIVGLVGAGAAGTAVWCWYLQPRRRRVQLYRNHTLDADRPKPTY